MSDAPTAPPSADVARVAVVTVPEHPFGRALALGLAQRGWPVGLLGMGAAPDGLAAELSSTGVAAAAVPCEFDGPNAVVDALTGVREAVGPVGLLVHGFPLFAPHPPRPLVDIDESGWTIACESTLKAALFTLQGFHAATVDARAGAAGSPHRATAVLVVPTFAMSGSAGQAPLAAAGEGIRALAKSAARQWGAEGIAVHTLAVDATTLLGAAAAGPPRATLAVPTLGEVDARLDVAPVLAWLASDDARAMTGQTFVVDGGAWMAR